MLAGYTATMRAIRDVSWALGYSFAISEGARPCATKASLNGGFMKNFMTLNTINFSNMAWRKKDEVL